MKINNNPPQIQIGEVKFRESVKQTNTETKDIVSLGNSEQPDNICKLKDMASQGENKFKIAGKIALIAGGSILMGAALGGSLVTLPMVLLTDMSLKAAAIAGGVTGLLAGPAVMVGFMEGGNTGNNAPVGLPLNPDQYNAGDFGLPRDPDDPLYGT